MLFLCNIANVAQKTFEIIQKSRSHEHNNLIISTRTFIPYSAKFSRRIIFALHRTLKIKLREIEKFRIDLIMESGWNLWVWLVGVVSRRWVWLVGEIYGCG